jgi:hypothetical protein
MAAARAASVASTSAAVPGVPCMAPTGPVDTADTLRPHLRANSVVYFGFFLFPYVNYG